MYINRHIEKSIKRLENMYKAILITGPRQAGKTTFLLNYKKKIEYINFDDFILKENILNEPNSFFKNHPLPLILDEVQRVPEAFVSIKNQIDKKDKMAQCYLSGSQSFLLMKNVSDSLAGRLGIIKLFSLSQREKFNVKFYDEFLPTDEYIDKKRNTKISDDDIWNEILNGGYPKLFTSKGKERKIFWQNYISEYLDRDVRDLSQVGDLLKFHNFIKMIASQVGDLLNVSRIASELQMNIKTVEKYLSILEASNIIYVLKPYYNSLSTRLIKSPKIYFMDTGLLCHMLGWEEVNTLKNGPMSGHILENYVISEILKSYYNNLDNSPQIYFYRDKDMKEIDLIIEKNQTLYPIEIKKHADPSTHDIKHFQVLNRFKNVKVGEGALISFYDDPMYINDKVRNVPIAYL